MKFRTTIKLTVDAKDKNEATEIAGEYLSGNLTTGVEMHFRTQPVSRNRSLISAAVACVLIASLLVIHTSYLKRSQGFIPSLSCDSVMQPSLRTSAGSNGYADFKKEWQVQHNKEALNSLSK